VFYLKREIKRERREIVCVQEREGWRLREKMREGSGGD